VSDANEEDAVMVRGVVHGDGSTTVRGLVHGDGSNTVRGLVHGDESSQLGANDGCRANERRGLMHGGVAGCCCRGDANERCAPGVAGGMSKIGPSGRRGELVLALSMPPC